MKKLLTCLIAACIALTYTCVSFAINPIIVDYLSGTTTFGVGGNGTAYYSVAVHPAVTPSNVPLSFHFVSATSKPELISVQQITTGATPPACGFRSLCGSPFLLSSGQSCCLALTMTSNTVGGYIISPLVETIPSAYSGEASLPPLVTVTSTPDLTSLRITPSTLALSIDYSVVYAALTGKPRQLMLRNQGLNDAVNLLITPSGLPAGTVMSTTCGSRLAAGSTCTITITPGRPATSNCTTGIAPTPGTISISATNIVPIQSNVVVLGYGCIEQGGYIYAIDDTTPKTESIGARVVQTTDSTGTNGIFWDSSTGCTTSPYQSCYVTSADSDSNGTNLASPSPGGNTYIIYHVLTTTHGESVNSYAAGLCTRTIATYNDWYLPAICEMGYGTNSLGINCGTSSTPALQNMQSNLIDGGTDIAGLTTGGNPSFPGVYWSSTELGVDPSTLAWEQVFTFSGGIQDNATKGNINIGVRCARALIFF